MLNTLLPQLGLSPDESLIYESLLKNGPQTVAQLTASTPIKRTYIYALCEQLTQKKLIANTLEGKKTTYHLLSPSTLLIRAEEQKNQAESAYLQLQAMMPGLTSQYIIKEEQPVVQIFEGFEGVKKVYEDTITEGKPICALVETSHLNQQVYDWVTTEYTKKRVEQKIWVKAIVASGPNTPLYTQLDEKDLRETKIVESKDFPFKNEIIIYGNKISIINHQKDSHLLGIIIERSQMAQTFQSWFDLTWKLLK